MPSVCPNKGFKMDKPAIWRLITLLVLIADIEWSDLLTISLFLQYRFFS